MAIIWLPVYVLGLVAGLAFGTKTRRLGFWLMISGFVLFLVGFVVLSRVQMGGLIFSAFASMIFIPVTLLGAGLWLGSRSRSASGIDWRWLTPAILLPALLTAWMFVRDANRAQDVRERVAAMGARTLSGGLGGAEIRFPAAPYLTAYVDGTPIRLGFNSDLDGRPDGRHTFTAVVRNAPGECKVYVRGAPCETPNHAADWCASRPELADSPWCELGGRSRISFHAEDTYLLGLWADNHDNVVPTDMECDPTRDEFRKTRNHLTRLCQARFSPVPGVMAIVSLDGVEESRIADVLAEDVALARRLWAAMHDES